MNNFLGIFTDVVRILTFQTASGRIRNDFPRREDQLFGADVKARRDFPHRRGHSA